MRIGILIISAAGLAATPALAHPGGHDDEQFRAPRIVQKSIPEKAQEAVVKLVTQAKLPASWSNVQPLTTQRRAKKGVQQWVVTFRNNAIRNAARRTLYVIMTEDGTFISANHRLV